MNMKLLDGIPILGGINTTRLEIDSMGRVTRTEGEGQRLCGELEFSCKLCFCQDMIWTRPRTIFWANPRARDFDVGGNVLGGESL